MHIPYIKWWVPTFFLVALLQSLGSFITSSRKNIIGASLWVFIIGASYNAGGWYADSANINSLKGKNTSIVPTSTAHAGVKNVSTLPGGKPQEVNSVIPVAPRGSIRNGYAWGNCTWYVAGRRHIPRNWGHARTWYPNAQRAGWSVGAEPKVGAIGWTARGGRGYGHVVLVEKIEGGQVYIAEMNYTGLNRISHRWVPANSFKYIYEPK